MVRGKRARWARKHQGMLKGPSGIAGEMPEFDFFSKFVEMQGRQVMSRPFRALLEVRIGRFLYMRRRVASVGPCSVRRFAFGREEECPEVLAV